MNNLLSFTAWLFLDAVRITNQQVNLSDLSVHSTSKGNWDVYYQGKRITTVAGWLLDEDTIEVYHLKFNNN